LVDEAGMVGSEDLARLISHADDAGAKLVLVGDPEQLGEIEAGGLFAALGKRSEPVYLDEVIRHNHALDRDAAKRIRESQGREALALYRSQERVTVAPDAEARREAIVADWWRSYREGQDALMVAKRNAEVERLNATARELMRSEGRLGSEEIEVGEAGFAAGDLLITHVNDRRADIYNRERWRVAEVDVQKGSPVLEGTDQARRVEVGPEYLSRTNPYDEPPALQHAYAVTIYCAQGTTVDRAFVVADPSMDKQELYVASSRSREETHLYATPEIQAERSEYAPRAPERDAIAHIAEAAERDRSQTAAHDEALHFELRKLPTKELVARRDDLSDRVATEGRAAEVHREASERLDFCQRRYENMVVRRETAEALPRRERKRELPRAIESEENSRQHLEAQQARVRQLEPVSEDARRERKAAQQVLAERGELAITAARISPPPYIIKELGERPSDPAKRKAWERGVKAIETLRQDNGITDNRHALGEAQRGRERAAQDARREGGCERPSGSWGGVRRRSRGGSAVLTLGSVISSRTLDGTQSIAVTLKRFFCCQHLICSGASNLE
jgi:AAA domain